ncbi:MAG TPA: hypothetical protein VGB17_08990 [Pyrinomonadaceae bacterium]
MSFPWEGKLTEDGLDYLPKGKECQCQPGPTVRLVQPVLRIEVL